MRSRAVQLGLVMALGLALGFLVTRDWRAGEAAGAAAPSVLASEPSAAAAKPKTPDAGSSPGSGSVDTTPPPPTRSFKLPTVAPPVASAPAPTTTASDSVPKRPPPTVMVPSEWLLRGSGPQNYDLTSDRLQVRGGNASALLKSHDKNIPLLRSGSIMQTAVAEPFIGKRVEFSAYLRAEDTREGTVALWFRAVDPNNLLLVSASSKETAPKVTGDWARYSVVVDVPWSAAEVGYGVSLLGKGAVWIDDAKIDAVDKAAVPLAGMLPVQQRGIAVQVAKETGPLPSPANLGFEEITAADATLRDVPPDSIAGARF